MFFVAPRRFYRNYKIFRAGIKKTMSEDKETINEEMLEDDLGIEVDVENLPL